MINRALGIWGLGIWGLGIGYWVLGNRLTTLYPMVIGGSRECLQRGATNPPNHATAVRQVGCAII